MKTSVALLILGLFYLGEAQVQPMDHQAEEGKSTKMPEIELACDCSGNSSDCQLVVTPKELEAKMKNTDPQLENQSEVVRGKNIRHLSYGIYVSVVCLLYLSLNKINIVMISHFHETSQGNRVASFKSEIKLTDKNVSTDTGAYDPATGKQRSMELNLNLFCLVF